MLALEQCLQDWSRSGASPTSHWEQPRTLTASELGQILGTIKSIHPTTEFEGYSFIIADAHDILGDCKLGDSIAVNGCCLTVTRFDANEGWFEVGLANETLSRTNLGPSVVSSPRAPWFFLRN